MSTIYIKPTATGQADGGSVEDAMGIGQLNSAIARAGAGGTVVLLSDFGPYHLKGSISLYNGGENSAPVSIVGQTSEGMPMPAEIIGTRPEQFSPDMPAGNETFRLMPGADHLEFRDLAFENVGSAFRAGGDISDITIEDVTASNVRRFFEDYPSGSNRTATIDGLTIRDVDVEGFSRNVIRLRDDSRNILIEDVRGDSQRQDGDDLAVGVHLEGTVHDVVIRRVTMENAQTSSDGYWNGDGFATERGVYGVLFEDTVARGNADGGYDLKSTDTVLLNPVAERNGRNFRFWGEVEIYNALGLDPHHHGGSVGGQKQVQILNGADVLMVGGSFADSGSATVVVTRDGGVLTLREVDIVHAAGADVLRGLPADALQGSAVEAVAPTGSSSSGTKTDWTPVDDADGEPGKTPNGDVPDPVDDGDGSIDDVPVSPVDPPHYSLLSGTPLLLSGEENVRADWSEMTGEFSLVSASGSNLGTLSLGDGTLECGLMVVVREQGSVLSAEGILSAGDLVEGQGSTELVARLGLSAFQHYLSGDNSSAFRISLDTGGAEAGYHNTLGAYVLDAAGDMVRVSLIAADASAASGPVLIDGLAAGETLHFFLVQNGAVYFDEDSTVSLIEHEGQLAVTRDGERVEDAVTFFSHDDAANPDGQSHVLGGLVDRQSNALRIGFEDLLRAGGSDEDFQDVLFTVEAHPPADLLFG